MRPQPDTMTIVWTHLYIFDDLTYEIFEILYT